MAHRIAYALNKRRVWLLCVGVSFYMSFAVPAIAQSLIWLDNLVSEGFGVSADGRVVVGRGRGDDNRNKAVRWQIGPSGVTRQVLGTIGQGTLSVAYNVSLDGTVIVGFSYYDSNNSKRMGFYWTPQTGMVSLGTLGGDESEASDVQAGADLVIVGWARDSQGRRRAFRWVNGAMQDLGTLGGNESLARAVGRGPGGKVVVGEAQQADGRWRAFRWVLGVGMQSLGTVRAGSPNSTAFDVSGDGSVVVGADYTGGTLPYYTGFIWNENSPNRMEELPFYSGGQLAPSWSPRSISSDGRVIVGWDNNAGPVRWIFDNSQGEYVLQPLNQVYGSLLGSGGSFEEVWAVSLDGRYIVGRGRPTSAPPSRAYILDTWRTGDTNGDGCIDDADLLAVLFAFGSSGTGLTRHEDINKDGIVDDADLLIVLFNFGQGC